MENTVVPEVSQDLVVIFKIKQSTVRNNLPSDNVTPYKSGIFKTPLIHSVFCLMTGPTLLPKRFLHIV
jgi:hypothetical protein